MRNLRMLLLDVMWTLVLLVAWPWLLWRAVVLGKGRTGWGERFGNIPARSLSDARPCVWFHAVSVGEVNLLTRLIERLRSERPHVAIAVSVTTDTGRQRAEQLYGEFASVFFYPYDFSWAIRRAFQRQRPSVVVLAELEVWPNFVTVMSDLGVPVLVANGRISDRAYRRYRWIRWLFAPALRQLTGVAAQERTYAERFIALGARADDVHVLGTMKADTAEVADELPGSAALAEALALPWPRDGEAPVLVVGQSGPGEEDVLIAVYEQLLPVAPNLRLLIAPRKPERFDAVAELIRRRGFALIRRSQPESTAAPLPPTSTAKAAPPIVLLDTLGELRTAYTLATLVFVGRSLAKMGGSDVLEVAGLARPMVVGPHTRNFAGPVEVLRAGGGLVQTGSDLLDEDPPAVEELATILGDWLRNPEAAAAVGQRARDVLQTQQGSTQRHLQMLLDGLPSSTKVDEDSDDDPD